MTEPIPPVHNFAALPPGPRALMEIADPPYQPQEVLTCWVHFLENGEDNLLSLMRRRVTE